MLMPLRHWLATICVIEARLSFRREGRTHPLTVYLLRTLNPLELKIGWEGLSPRASNKRCRLSEENGIPEFANLAWILRLSLGLNPQLSSP